MNANSPNPPVRESEQARRIVAPKQRILYIDLIKIVSIVTVIAVHVSSALILDPNTSPSYWWTADFFASLSIFGAITFVMCSGAVLLSSSRSMPIGQFYKKRLPKIIIPLLGWCALYYLYGCYTGDFHFNVLTFVKKTLTSRLAGHLWFLHMIIGLYLAIPFIHPIFHKAEKEYTLFFLVFCFTFSSLNRVLSYFFAFEIFVPYTIFTDFIGYFVLGYFFTRHKPYFSTAMLWSATLFFCSLTVTMLGNNYVMRTGGNIMMVFFRPDSITALLMAIAVFIFFQAFTFKRLLKHQALLTSAGYASYGIYLSHAMVIDILNRGYLGFKLTSEWIHPGLAIPVKTVLTFVLCYLLSVFLQKIPYARRLVS